MRTILFFLLFSITLRGMSDEGTPTICLNMIVKNESKSIESCLNSVKQIIDYWVIVDAGSTDGTKEVIKKCMKGIPGVLYQRKWVDFGHHRTEALELAKDKGDYILWMNADEKLECLSALDKSLLTRDLYFVTVKPNVGSDYQRPLFMNNHLEWNWNESLGLVTPEEVLKIDYLTHIVNLSEEQNAQDSQKHLNIAKNLEWAFVKDPTNGRTVYYIAQSYANGGDFESAILNYEKRAVIGGWDQEIYLALYQSALLQEQIGRPKQEIIHAYCRAFQFRPSRAEPLHKLVLYFLKEKEYILAYLLAKEALSIPMPTDFLSVEKIVYDYDLLIQFSNAAAFLGKYDETCSAYEQLLTKTLPDSIRRQVKNNLFTAKSKVLTAQTLK